MSAAFELQKAIFVALDADAPLAALVSDEIYDDVPDDHETFPYVTIGEDVLTQWDTDGTTGFEASVTIHTWSRYRGAKEVKEIQQAIYDVLHNSGLTITGYDTILIQQRSQEAMRDPDGKTRHGVQTFEVLLDKQ